MEGRKEDLQAVLMHTMEEMVKTHQEAMAAEAAKAREPLRDILEKVPARFMPAAEEAEQTGSGVMVL